MGYLKWGCPTLPQGWDIGVWQSHRRECGNSTRTLGHGPAQAEGSQAPLSVPAFCMRRGHNSPRACWIQGWLAAPPDPGPSAEGLEEGEGSEATSGGEQCRVRGCSLPSLMLRPSSRAHSRRGQGHISEMSISHLCLWEA